jgi:hypothetical protein
MFRPLAAVLLGALALAPAAAADVVPLADRDHTGVPALDGGSVVYVNADRSRLRVFEQPLAGGAAAELARVADPDAGRAGWALDAGTAGLALRMYTTGRPRLFAGPRQGPLALVQRRARRGVLNVEQRDLFAVPGGPLVLERTDRKLRAVLRPPGGRAQAVPMPSGADLQNLAVAGAVAAVATRDEVVLVDLPSGTVRRRLPLGDLARASLISLGVSEVGDVALIVEDGSGADVLGWAPAGATEPRVALVGDEFGHVRTAGGLIALEVPAMRGDAERVAVLDPASDPPRELFRGPPSAYVRGIDFDGRYVAWATDGCQLVADVGSPAINVIPAGPCVRTEASFTQYVPSSVRYRIRCIATPGRRCRIDLRVHGARLQRLARRVVTIPRGRARKIRVPVRAEIFITTARVIDPDGRRRVAITF